MRKVELRRIRLSRSARPAHRVFAGWRGLQVGYMGRERIDILGLGIHVLASCGKLVVGACGKTAMKNLKLRDRLLSESDQPAPQTVSLSACFSIMRSASACRR